MNLHNIRNEIFYLSYAYVGAQSDIFVDPVNRLLHNGTPLLSGLIRATGKLSVSGQGWLLESTKG